MRVQNALFLLTWLVSRFMRDYGKCHQKGGGVEPAYDGIVVEVGE